MLEVLELSGDDTRHLGLLQDFLNSAGKSLLTFRYYSKRPLTVVGQHLCTLLLMSDEQPVAYGHLDRENEKIWLGIAVAEGYTEKGLGRKMMDQLIGKARQNSWSEIFLSVDKSNSAAIPLYQTYGFTIARELNEQVYLMQLILDRE
ncbi:GNAT family N-acetyltransferase [Pseudobacter ginsenosidimutans]|uniref:Acetyltransferase (GNAT) family protein n=1 Tax=Pseudobacter ginsenosidimutans TaxID=661488 RepID=A0A4V2F130_9BACT|nr:GNAT family N-acetyltransferase [Pseudobacter ginsenosidimutans]QEC41047.1 GNAT family N-acetyltransferase [Pseudobacter ginsenosidimutans]RZS72201.1 acetyltransferase (GNAT) family protein [Pseudobacter ginsenosidimutans]